MCGLQDIQSTIQIATELCGFLTIVAGTFLLHTTRDLDVSFSDLGRLTTARAAAGMGIAQSGSMAERAGSATPAAGSILLASLTGKDRDRDGARERSGGLPDRMDVSYHSVAVDDSSLLSSSNKPVVGNGLLGRTGIGGGMNKL